MHGAAMRAVAMLSPGHAVHSLRVAQFWQQATQDEHQAIEQLSELA